MEIRVLDILDILLVAIFIYQLYQIIRGTTAITIFFGILSMYILYLLVDALEMRLLSQILGQFIGVGVLALIIVFQQEIRRFLLLVGTRSLQNRFTLLRKLFPNRFRSIQSQLEWPMEEIEKAVKVLSENRTGAILVFIRESDLKVHQRSGIPIDGQTSTALLLNLFFKNNPLHDGAVLLKGNRIVSARCILPLTEQPDLPEGMGLRHRAGMGITEISDAIALIISEQTGKISVAVSGKIESSLKAETAIRKIAELLTTGG